MSFYRQSLLSALLSFLLFVSSDCTILLDALPDELLLLVQQDLPAELSLAQTSSRLRRVLLHDTMLPLNRKFSRMYILNEDDIRAKTKLARKTPQKQIRLNLGEDFREYMVDADFRAHVDVLVDNPVEQVWSDVVILFLNGTKVRDITALAGLRNLEQLYLGRTQVQDISALAGLVSLKELYLNDSQVKDISPLAALVTLEHLSLSGIRVHGISALAGLPNLRIFT